jgi:hypothetical protein
MLCATKSNNDMSDDRKDKNFTQKTVTTLGERAHFLCSKPDYRKLTTGPHSIQSKSLRTGEAAHIYSAKKLNARHFPNLADEKVKDYKDGIWLCRECHKLIDSDEKNTRLHYFLK